MLLRHQNELKNSAETLLTSSELQFLLYHTIKGSEEPFHYKVPPSLTGRTGGFWGGGAYRDLRRGSSGSGAGSVRLSVQHGDVLPAGSGVAQSPECRVGEHAAAPNRTRSLCQQGEGGKSPRAGAHSPLHREIRGARGREGCGHVTPGCHHFCSQLEF